MIRLRSGWWWNALFVYHGGVLPKMRVIAVLYFVYVMMLYKVCIHTHLTIASDGMKMIASCTSFMLVFRLNQCNARLVKAQDLITDAITSCRSIVFSVCSYTSHGNVCRGDWTAADHEAALLLKVHIIRLAVAFVVSLKFHMRAAGMLSDQTAVTKDMVWHAMADHLRVQSLLTAAEAKLVDDICGLYEKEGQTYMCGNMCGMVFAENVEVDFNRYRSSSEVEGRTRMFTSGGGLGRGVPAGEEEEPDHGGTSVPLFILQLLRGLLMRPLGKRWGYPERYLNFNEACLGKATRAYEGMHQMVLMPLPLPYLQLCKMLLLVFIITYPIGIHLNHGIWGNVVIPWILSMSLWGFQVVADFMENPMGDDPADISLYELIHEFEVEVQAMFDLSVRDHAQVVQSWRGLADHFGLGLGSPHLCPASGGGGGAVVCPSGSGAEAEFGQRPARFTDFFVWAPLPKGTVRYIITQSSDASVASKYVNSQPSKGGRPIRNSMAAPAGADSDGAASSASDDEFGGSLGHGGDIDVWTIKRCLSLRGPAQHRQRVQSQIVSLDLIGDSMARCASIRAGLYHSLREVSSDLAEDPAGI